MSTSAMSVVIVGAGAAGLAVAEALRREGFSGRVSVIGDEPVVPYDRPPLSKQFLAGQWDAARLALRSRDQLEALDLDLRLGVSATWLDDANHEVALSDGSSISYDALAIATGVRARRLPGTEHMPNVHTLRSLVDVEMLRDDIAPGRRLLVVGAGFLGSEAAATARELGAEVTLVSDLTAPLADVIGPDIAELLTDAHRDHGVRLQTGVKVERALPSGGVALGDGRVLNADAVLTAIGSIPNTEWLAGSGISVGNGVLCDEFCRAAPGVWAAGDVASWPHQGYGERIRIEHRTNAGEQGLAVARNILAQMAGEPLTPYAPVPYVWSDNYDLKFQIHGLPRLADEVRVISGSAQQRRLVALYGRKGTVVGALGVNMFRDLRAARALVAASAPMPAVGSTSCKPTAESARVDHVSP